VVVAGIGLVVAAAACADQAAAPPETTGSSSTVLAITATTIPVTAAQVTAAQVTAAQVTASTAPVTTATATPRGFDRVLARITSVDGEVCEVCLWLAATTEQRQRGLMGVTDLGDADGMAFVYEAPHTGAFWMKNTLLPLSIGFYADDGYLGTFDMQPCTADPCPNYPTPIDFTVAIETELGGLAELGIEPGSTLDLTDLACD
jgi:uncharacterized membrane protein (UPF0127 family)